MPDHRTSRLAAISSFEWDENKRGSNIAKHGIDFRDAITIFQMPILVQASRRHGEDRSIALGVLEGRVVAVICTMRAQVCRIISARRARKYEERAYHQSIGRRP